MTAKRKKRKGPSIWQSKVRLDCVYSSYGGRFGSSCSSEEERERAAVKRTGKGGAQSQRQRRDFRVP